MDTVGGWLTITFTEADVVFAPKLSVAMAVMVYVPADTLFQVMLYGAVVEAPNKVEPLKNCT